MFKDQEWPGFIADETEEIVDKAVSLYQDQQIWEAASKRSKQILRSLIDPNWGKELTDALEKIQQKQAVRMENTALAATGSQVPRYYRAPAL